MQPESELNKLVKKSLFELLKGKPLSISDSKLKLHLKTDSEFGLESIYYFADKLANAIRDRNNAIKEDNVEDLKGLEAKIAALDTLITLMVQAYAEKLSAEGKESTEDEITEKITLISSQAEALQDLPPNLRNLVFNHIFEHPELGEVPTRVELATTDSLIRVHQTAQVPGLELIQAIAIPDLRQRRKIAEQVQRHFSNAWFDPEKKDHKAVMLTLLTNLQQAHPDLVALPSFETWKELSATAAPRSHWTKAVDKTYMAYLNDPTTENLQALSLALHTWLYRRDSQQDSRRYAAVNLLNQLIEEKIKADPGLHLQTRLEAIESKVQNLAPEFKPILDMIAKQIPSDPKKLQEFALMVEKFLPLLLHATKPEHIATGLVNLLYAAEKKGLIKLNLNDFKPALFTKFFLANIPENARQQIEERFKAIKDGKHPSYPTEHHLRCDSIIASLPQGKGTEPHHEFSEPSRLGLLRKLLAREVQIINQPLQRLTRSASEPPRADPIDPPRPNRSSF